MKRSELFYQYPEELVAREPRSDFRILFKDSGLKPPQEIYFDQLLDRILPNDLVLINDTKVEKRRVFAKDLEIVFVKALDSLQWEVLFPAKDFKVGDLLTLPGGITAELARKGLPQILKTDEPLSAGYFEEHGEPALPPYIQKARGSRHANSNDQLWYQTEWAQHRGSVAAPTAALHFSNKDWQGLQEKGVVVKPLTLHVGLGTFLPVKVENLNDHSMHSELVTIPHSTAEAIKRTQTSGKRVWALGTTVTRAVESLAAGKLKETENGFEGETDLLIQPGFEFQVVDVLMTNFHQPESTLLALLAAFAGLEEVKACYQWAIERKFRLFSYGDLSVWQKA